MIRGALNRIKFEGVMQGFNRLYYIFLHFLIVPHINPPAVHHKKDAWIHRLVVLIRYERSASKIERDQYIVARARVYVSYYCFNL